MILFGCKHKEIKVIACNKDARYYIVQCSKCGKQETRIKASGEEYQIGFKIAN